MAKRHAVRRLSAVIFVKPFEQNKMGQIQKHIDRNQPPSEQQWIIIQHTWNDLSQKIEWLFSIELKQLHAHCEVFLETLKGECQFFARSTFREFFKKHFWFSRHTQTDNVSLIVDWVWPRTHELSKWAATKLNGKNKRAFFTLFYFLPTVLWINDITRKVFLKYSW